MNRFVMPVDWVARICHEANRAIQIVTEDPSLSPHWDEAPQWQRDSAIEGVEAAQRGITDEELHEAWCDSKRGAGWTYGPVKDNFAKTHPCLVPYNELPAEQRVKDALFRAIVETLRPNAGAGVNPGVVDVDPAPLAAYNQARRNT